MSARNAMSAAVVALAGLLVAVGCSDADSAVDNDDGGGASTSSAGGSSNGGSGGSGGSTVSSGGAGGGGGTGGEGGSLPEWPSCDEAPANVPAMTIPDVWAADPAQPLEGWIAGVYVTAVSGGGCEMGKACQLFVQQETGFATPQAGYQQALRVFASPSAAEHFVGIAVGDRIDLRAFAWRHPEGELFFQVGPANPGCAKVVGSGALVPVEGLDLEDLTVELYKDTMGPLLIKLVAVVGTPKQPNQTFGLFKFGTSQPVEEVTSMSPFFLPGHVFTGLSPDLLHNFESVVGVFGLFTPPGDPPIDYEEIYIRTMDDVVVGGT